MTVFGLLCVLAALACHRKAAALVANPNLDHGARR